MTVAAVPVVGAPAVAPGSPGPGLPCTSPAAWHGEAQRHLPTAAAVLVVVVTGSGSSCHATTDLQAGLAQVAHPVVPRTHPAQYPEGNTTITHGE